MIFAFCDFSFLEEARKTWVAKFESQIDPEVDFQKREILLKKLIKGQLDMLGDGENVALVAFAEFVINVLLKFVQKTKSSTLEDLLSEFFLVNPETISKRKANKVVRTRDHKLQILFRIELHWLLANQEYQKKIEDETLVHLRQISIWDSQDEMLMFLQEFVTTFYVNRQPELLCLLYEELNQPPPNSVRALFSPFKKSECSR